MTVRYDVEWSVFAAIAFVFCLLLAFRPIPDSGSENDTVRYVTDLHQYCSEGLSKELVNKQASYQIFYGATSLACLTRSDGVFLFEAAFFIPLMFLLFSSWRNGTVFWAGSLLFSVFGLELMTNAMRQGFAMLLFFGAIALISKYRFSALLLGALAAVAHTSVLAFLPLLLWIASAQFSRKSRWIVGIFSLLFAMIVLFMNQTEILSFIETFDQLRKTYSLIYADELKTSFMAFMILPLYFVYGLRRFLERRNVSLVEHQGVVYSSVLLILCYIFFPYITYRFAIFAVAMQIFLVTLSDRQDVRIGATGLAGLVVHLTVMVSISSHFDELIYG